MQVFFSNIRPRIKHDLLTGSRIFTIPVSRRTVAEALEFLVHGCATGWVEHAAGDHVADSIGAVGADYVHGFCGSHLKVITLMTWSGEDVLGIRGATPEGLLGGYAHGFAACNPS
jgi:hypothetical protein